MDQLWHWLEDEPKTLKAIGGLIVLIVAISINWSFAMSLILVFFGVGLGSGGSRELMEAMAGGGSMIWIILLFILSFLFWAFLEEILFRFPLALLARLTASQNALLAGVPAISAFFGYLHGNWFNIFIQGVLGIFLSLAFLKGGGLHGRPFKGLFISTFAHFFYNAAITILFLIL